MTRPARRNRWLPRFGLRSLVALVALLAVVFAWIGNARRRHDAVEALLHSNPSTRIAYDFQREDNKYSAAARPAGWRGWLGDHYGVDWMAAPEFVELQYPTPDDLAFLARMPSVRQLHCYRAVDLDDASIARLAALKRLEELWIFDGTRLSDAALVQISHCRQLRALALDLSPRMTGEGLLALGQLKRLRKLDLQLCDSLDSPGAAVRREHLEALARALPECQIRVTGDVETSVNDAHLGAVRPMESSAIALTTSGQSAHRWMAR